jgi:hypothetical protein
MFIMLTLGLAALFASCDRMFDNIKDFADEEIVYSDPFDGIIRTQIGYERIEIDLMKAGRIPASKINMGKAQKTVIECPDFTEPDHRRVIDSICSWVNITGLNQLKAYQFTIYTEDEFGNRSLPLKTSARPYTDENLASLQLPAPAITESTSAAVVEWNAPVSSRAYKVIRHAYSYTDKSGVQHSGGNEGDLPSFFVDNIEKGRDFNILLNCRIIPTLLGEDGLYTPIIDTIDWKQEIKLRISENAVPAVFLKTPSNSISVDARYSEFPVNFSWTKVYEASRYVLKFSQTPNFPDASTVSIPLGDVDSYELDATVAQQLFESFPAAVYTLHWTIEGVSTSGSINRQSRQFTAIRKAPIEVDTRFADDLLLDVVFFSDGVAMDISSHREIQCIKDNTQSVVWSTEYNRYIARFNPISVGGSKANNDFSGIYRFIYKDDQPFINSITDGFSMEAVMKNTAISALEQKFFCNTEGAGYGFSTGNNGKAYFMVHTGAYVSPPQLPYTTDRYCHVVGIWDKSKTKVTFYMDGVKAGNPTTGANLTVPSVSNQWIGIGGDTGAGAQSLFKGDIVIARMYNSALTEDDVTYLYNQVKE